MSITLLRTTSITFVLFALATGLAACTGTLPADLQPAPGAATSAAPAEPVAAEPPAAPPQEGGRPPGWTEASHSNDVAPNYDVVFPADTVNTITITIAPEDWAAMQANLDELFASIRWMREALLEAGPDLSPDERMALMPQILAATAAEVAAGAAPPGAGESFSTESPIWVPATIGFQGQEWTHVGVRHKGVTSLQDRWMVGDLRLPFKFDFDEFEDDYPEIDNQRFFGFKELSFANNYQDQAGLRDSVVYELLAEAGLPAMRTAPVEIVLDYGEGPQRLGLYTMVEVVDDTGIPRHFGSDDGNIYEADGPGGDLSVEHAGEIEASFEKKNNDDAGWDDIRALYDALHDPLRTSDPAAWRAGLEAVFDVDGFLEWLGIAAVVGHGDTYGFGAHNYYLYNDPATDRLTWVSWDHNFTLRDDALRVTTLDKANVTDAWPLIRFLLDDPVYRERYAQLLAENFAGPLAPDALLERIRAHAALIAPVAAQDMSAEEYDAAVQEVVDFVAARAAEVEAFLAAQE
jgi:spore coat protein CotH